MASPEGTHLEPPELLPCPFCGRAAIYADEKTLKSGTTIISAGCPDRCARVHDLIGRYVAALAWNRRAPRHFTNKEQEALWILVQAIDELDASRTQLLATRDVKTMLDSSKGGET